MLEDIRVTMISKIKELVDYSNTHSVPSTKQKEIESLRYVKGNYDFLYYKMKGKKQSYIIKKFSTKYLVKIDIPYFVFNFGNNNYLKFNFFSTLQKYGIKWSFNKNDLERIY